MISAFIFQNLTEYINRRILLFALEYAAALPASPLRHFSGKTDRSLRDTLFDDDAMTRRPLLRRKEELLHFDISCFRSASLMMAHFAADGFSLRHYSASRCRFHSPSYRFCSAMLCMEFYSPPLRKALIQPQALHFVSPSPLIYLARRRLTSSARLALARLDCQIN